MLLSDILIVIWLVCLLITIGGTIIAFRHLAARVPAGADMPPVSVLKPLKGADWQLRENLAGFFALDYPQFELLFSVADDGDPAIAIVEELMAEFPHVEARLFVGDIDVGPNPKVRNLVRPYEAASHELIFISDSVTLVRPQTLREMVPELRDDVRVVTGTMAGAAPVGIGGQMAASWLNTFARAAYIFAWLGSPMVFGSALLFRRSDLDATGGIRGVADFIAEDVAIASRLKLNTNRKIGVRREPITQNVGPVRLAAFWSRHVRWRRLVGSKEPLVVLLEPFLWSLPVGAIGAFGFWMRGVPIAVFLPLHLLIWLACDLLMIARLQEGRTGLQTLVACLLREVLIIPIWIHSLLGNTISWRGKQIELEKGGKINWAPPQKLAVPNESD